jgi:arylsulfatase A-like enzyme
VDFINASTDDEPFYMQVNYTAPHWPWEGPGDQDVSARVTTAMRTDPSTALFNFEGGSLSKYAELVEVLDQSVGRLLQALESRGISENTIVVFMSDNGGERFSFMWPFVGEKGDLEEGGIRVPFILRWPRAIRPGQVTGLAAGTMDVTATALDAAGVAPHPDYPLDGTSLLGWIVDKEPPPQRDLLWRTQEQGAIRRGDFKLLIDRQAKPLWFRHFAKEGERVRLSNLVDDARERKDLSGEHVALVASMLDAWRAFDSQMLPYESAQALATTRTKANVNPSPLVPGRPD